MLSNNDIGRLNLWGMVLGIGQFLPERLKLMPSVVFKLLATGSALDPTCRHSMSRVWTNPI